MKLTWPPSTQAPEFRSAVKSAVAPGSRFPENACCPFTVTVYSAASAPQFLTVPVTLNGEFGQIAVTLGATLSSATHGGVLHLTVSGSVCCASGGQSPVAVATTGNGTSAPAWHCGMVVFWL